MVVNSNPWTVLDKPPQGNINKIKIDEDLKWDFYWGKDSSGTCLFILAHSFGDQIPVKKFPGLRSIKTDNKELKSEGFFINFRLTDSNLTDIFYIMCQDIFESSIKADTEEDVINAAINCLGRWYYLLRGGKPTELSEEEQKGLIGELLILERYFLKFFPAIDAVQAWTGPEGKPKDFLIHKTGVECKAHRDAKDPHIVLTSEHQLDTSDVESLTLSVLTLDRSESADYDAFTLTEVAKRIYKKIESSDTEARNEFEHLLLMTGFLWKHDYTGYQWTEKDTVFYSVSEKFPRITPDSYIEGVSKVRYRGSLDSIPPGCFATESELISILKASTIS